jgi:hypothetical protein
VRSGCAGAERWITKTNPVRSLDACFVYRAGQPVRTLLRAAQALKRAQRRLLGVAAHPRVQCCLAEGCFRCSVLQVLVKARVHLRRVCSRRTSAFAARPASCARSAPGLDMANPFVPAAVRAHARDRARWFWLPSPTLDAAAGAYVWYGLELRASPGRGQGVFATLPLPAGLLLAYGGSGETLKRLQTLAKRDRDRFVACVGSGRAGTLGLNADPALLPAGRAFAWPGSRLNEASPGELYNCRFVWLDRLADTADQPTYPFAAPSRLRCYMELMVDVPVGAELLCSYDFGSARSRPYAVAPPPPRSTPVGWGQHLPPPEARALRAARERAELAAVREEAEAAGHAAAAAVRARWLARDRGKLVLENAAAGKAKRSVRAEKCARMREAKRAKRMT